MHPSFEFRNPPAPVSSGLTDNFGSSPQPGGCTLQGLASSLISLKAVSGTAAVRTAVAQLLRCVVRFDSLIPSRMAVLSMKYAIQHDATNPTNHSSTPSSPIANIAAPPSPFDSATPRKLRSLARQHTNAVAWRAIAEFFEPAYIARLREIGRWPEPASATERSDSARAGSGQPLLIGPAR